MESRANWFFALSCPRYPPHSKHLVSAPVIVYTVEISRLQSRGQVLCIGSSGCGQLLAVPHILIYVSEWAGRGVASTVP
jgi:hypothetical protein